MGDLREEAHCLYTKLMAFMQSRIGQQDEDGIKHISQQRQNINELILQFICVCPPEDRFKYGEFPKIISDSAKSQHFEPEKAAQGFLCLEDYIMLLYLMPWKTEYQNIKKYGGHYQTKIASHIKGAEIILSLIGFTDLTTGLMILSHHTKHNVLIYIAFECLVASAECVIISQIWKNVRDTPKLSLSDVVQLRLENSGNADTFVSLIESRFGACNRGHNEQVEKVERRHEKKSVSTSRGSSLFHDKLQQHIKKAEKIGGSLDKHNDIPYMDEDVKEFDHKPENFEDHLLASLQLVDDKMKDPEPCGPADKPALRASQEWSFVREGLEKKHGKKYFDGPREDILKQQFQDVAKESPYVQMIVEPKYANGPFPKFTQHFPTSNITGDSAYHSASTTVYPPKVDDPRRGQIKSDIIKTKGAQHSSIDINKGHTAPIIKKLADTSKAAHTFPGKQGALVSPMDGFRVDNIRKYQKSTPSSMPIHCEQIMLSDSVNRTSYTPSQRAVPNVLGTRTSRSSVDNIGNSNGQAPRFITGRCLDNPMDGTNDMNRVPMGGKTLNQIPVIRQQTKTVQQWECLYCTFINMTPDPVCSMCFKTRDGTEIDGPLVGEVSRVCAKCTLENGPHSRLCTACGSELKGMQTVI